jgi:hypothetical protein
LNETQRTLAGVVTLVAVAVAIDLVSSAVRGLWPSALLVALGWLFIWRTGQEVAPSFTGPERHRPWLQTTGWFFVGAGLLGILLSLLSVLAG